MEGFLVLVGIVLVCNYPLQCFLAVVVILSVCVLIGLASDTASKVPSTHTPKWDESQYEMTKDFDAYKELISNNLYPHGHIRTDGNVIRVNHTFYDRNGISFDVVFNVKTKWMYVYPSYYNEGNFVWRDSTYYTCLFVLKEDGNTITFSDMNAWSLNAFFLVANAKKARADIYFCNDIDGDRYKRQAHFDITEANKKLLQEQIAFIKKLMPFFYSYGRDNISLEAPAFSKNEAKEIANTTTPSTSVTVPEAIPAKQKATTKEKKKDPDFALWTFVTCVIIAIVFVFISCNGDTNKQTFTTSPATASVVTSNSNTKETSSIPLTPEEKKQCEATYMKDMDILIRNPQEEQTKAIKKIIDSVFNGKKWTIYKSDDDEYTYCIIPKTRYVGVYLEIQVDTKQEEMLVSIWYGALNLSHKAVSEVNFFFNQDFNIDMTHIGSKNYGDGTLVNSRFTRRWADWNDDAEHILKRITSSCEVSYHVYDVNFSSEDHPVTWQNKQILKEEIRLVKKLQEKLEKCRANGSYETKNEPAKKTVKSAQKTKPSTKKDKLISMTYFDGHKYVDMHKGDTTFRHEVWVTYLDSKGNPHNKTFYNKSYSEVRRMFK